MINKTAGNDLYEELKCEVTSNIKLSKALPANTKDLQKRVLVDIQR